MYKQTYAYVRQRARPYVPSDHPLAPAHVPAAPAHRPAQHSDDDTQTLETGSRHWRGRVGALRGRHRATTY
eukprot:2972398-Prymnesium_polylepis.1